MFWLKYQYGSIFNLVERPRCQSSNLRKNTFIHCNRYQSIKWKRFNPWWGGSWSNSRKFNWGTIKSRCCLWVRIYLSGKFRSECLHESYRSWNSWKYRRDWSRCWLSTSNNNINNSIQWSYVIEVQLVCRSKQLEYKANYAGKI